MKNVTTIKSKDKIASPKTPGGISKYLLTPCRRVGLSRSWRTSGISPFISPLSNSQNNIHETQTEKNPRKRKNASPEKELDEDVVGDTETSTLLKKSKSESDEAAQTPTRPKVIRKRSKALLLHKESLENESPIENTQQCENLQIIQQNINTKTHVSRLSSRKSKSKTSIDKLTQILDTDADEVTTPNKRTVTTENELKVQDSHFNETDDTNEKSPKNLTTECFVVIQNKIMNNLKIGEKNKQETSCPKASPTSLDSDSDDIPLCQINKKEEVLPVNKKEIEKNTNSEDLSGNKKENKVAKLEHKKTSTTDLKTLVKKTKAVNKKSNKEKANKVEKVRKYESKSSSQSSNSFDDDDDDDFDHKRTIIIRKTYDKVKLPTKAKSTGSITDKDIKELKARIKAKKKLLIVKAMGSDTEDLRGLIKKWQKGCQDALVELMELMKTKMPDQPNMDNAQILEMLKIPQDLVGYDSENDCFNSPDDTNVILSSLKI